MLTEHEDNIITCFNDIDVSAYYHVCKHLLVLVAIYAYNILKLEISVDDLHIYAQNKTLIYLFILFIHLHTSLLLCSTVTFPTTAYVVSR